MKNIKIESRIGIGGMGVVYKAHDARAILLLEQASEQGHEQAEIALNYIQYADGGIGC